MERGEKFDLLGFRLSLAHMRYAPFTEKWIKSSTNEFRHGTTLVVKSIQRGDERILAALNSDVVALQQETTLITPPILSAYFTRRSGKALQEGGVHHLVNGRHDLFMLYFDAGFSIGYISGLLLLAIMPNKQLASDVARSTGDLAEKAGFSMSDQSSIFLDIHNQASKCRALLQEDPDGFLLIREAAKIITGEPNRISSRNDGPFPFLRPEFTAAGAAYAKRVYPAVLPLSKQLLKESS